MLTEFGPFLVNVERMQSVTKDPAKLKSIVPYLKLFENIKARRASAHKAMLLSSGAT